MEVTPAGATIQVDGTATFQAVARDENGDIVADPQVGWTTSDANILALDGHGIVRGVAVGTASVVAWWGELSASQEVTVQGSGSTGEPASISASSVTSQQAVAGTAVSAPPAVVVLDDQGNGVAGITIDFRASAGSGTVSPAQAVTDGNGRAAATSWVIGGTIGATNTVTATAQGVTLTGNPVTFEAVGTEDVPPPPPGEANFLWTSDWGSGTGNGLSAIQDNGVWTDRLCVGGSGQLIRVANSDATVAGLPAHWPTNMLEVDHNGSSCDAVQVQNQWPAPALGDTIWFRVHVWLDKCDVQTGPVHNVQSNTGSIAWTVTEDQCEGGRVPIGFKSYFLGGGQQWSPGATVEGSIPLRYEWGLIRQSTSRYGALVRIYDDRTDTLLFDEDDLRLYTGQTLAEFNRTEGFDYSGAGADMTFRSWILGQQGPGMATGFKQGAYNYAGAAVCNPGPCGRYTPGEGN